MEGMTHANDTPPNAAEIEAIALATIETLPDAFKSEALQIALRVEDFASETTLRELAIDDPFSLTGLYEGIPLTEKSVFDQPSQPNVIWLFRRPILDEWVDRGNVSLNALVAHVYIHELAHHFGWSDEDIATIDQWWT